MANVVSVIKDALSLPTDERAHLLRVLSESLEDGDGLSQGEWAAAWGPELQRRLHEMKSGDVEGVDWADALAALKIRISGG